MRIGRHGVVSARMSEAQVPSCQKLRASPTPAGQTETADVPNKQEPAQSRASPNCKAPTRINQPTPHGQNLRLLQPTVNGQPSGDNRPVLHTNCVQNAKRLLLHLGWTATCCRSTCSTVLKTKHRDLGPLDVTLGYAALARLRLPRQSKAETSLMEQYWSINWRIHDEFMLLHTLQVPVNSIVLYVVLLVLYFVVPRGRCRKHKMKGYC
ncbi:hypothetical protein EDB80DRAFT_295030 [Ilyonectria destructans]|nr:hypothetical protein EDB80DRAFT_295030 [Ilyonectria destructans]